MRQVFDIGHDSEDDVGHISSAVRALNVDSLDGRWAQGVPVSEAPAGWFMDPSNG